MSFASTAESAPAAPTTAASKVAGATSAETIRRVTQA
jgi:hypothetical protein